MEGRVHHHEVERRRFDRCRAQIGPKYFRAGVRDVSLRQLGGAPGEARPVLDGGGEWGLHISGLSYVVIHDLEVRFMIDNGINLDDRGEHDNPLAAHHVVLQNVDIHGIGGDETEWERYAQPDVLLDNLIADGKAVSAAPAAGVNAHIIGFAEVSAVAGDIAPVLLARGVLQGAA